MIKKGLAGNMQLCSQRLFKVVIEALPKENKFIFKSIFQVNRKIGKKFYFQPVFSPKLGKCMSSLFLKIDSGYNSGLDKYNINNYTLCVLYILIYILYICI